MNRLVDEVYSKLFTANIAEISKATKITRGMLYRYSNDKKKLMECSVKIFFRIAHILGVEVK